MPFNLLFPVRVSQQEVDKLLMLWVNAITHNFSYFQRWPPPSFATYAIKTQALPPGQVVNGIRRLCSDSY